MFILLQIQKAKNKFKAVRKKIKDTFDDLQQLVEQRRREAEQEVQAQEDVTMTSLKAWETSRAALASNASTVEKLVSTAPPAALLGMAADLTSRLDQLQSHTATATAGQLARLPEFAVDSEALRELQAGILTLGELVSNLKGKFT